MRSYAERSAQAYSAAGYGTTFRSPAHPAPPSSLQQQQSTPNHSNPYESTLSYFHAAQEQEQMRLLTDSLRHVQEHASLIRQAMEKDDLPMVLDKAMSFLYILGDTKTHRSHLSSTTTTAQEGSDNPILSIINNHKHISLSAKNYYELHMRVCEELVLVEEYFLTFQTTRNGYSLIDVFEMVQYCPRVLPRAYLRICCAASVLRSMKESKDSMAYQIGPIPFILKEISDTVKCVQCPMPGLFARYYLLQVLKDVLPDDTMETNNTTIISDTSEICAEPPCASSSSTSSSSIQISYNFLIGNFIEMNKLWIRMQHLPDENPTSMIQSPSSSILSRRGNPPVVVDAKVARKKRERERNELRVLVGTNIVRLSQLEGVTSTVYGTIVLPKLLEHIVSCRDPLAQAYLMDCIIHVFPDEYHIQTLEIFLSVCPKLREKVNIRTIIQSMMDRLANYFRQQLTPASSRSRSRSNSEEDNTGLRDSLIMDSFQMFANCVRCVVENRSGSIPLKDIVRLEATLMKYSLRCIPTNTNHISECLENCKSGLDNRGAVLLAAASNEDQPPSRNTEPTIDDQAIAELESFLILPLGYHVIDVLRNNFYSDLLSLLPWNHRMNVSRSIVKAILASESKLDNVNDLQTVLSLIVPLLQDEPKKEIGNDNSPCALSGSVMVLGENEVINIQSNKLDESQISFIPEDMVMITQFIHSVESPDTDTWFELIHLTGSFIAKGGDLRQGYTVHSLFYAALRLIETIQQREFPINQNQDINEIRVDEQIIFAKNTNCRKVLVFIQSQLTLLRSLSSRDGFALFLNAAVAADRCSRLSLQSRGSYNDFPAIAYEFFTQALSIYDECPMVDAKQQIIFLNSLIGTLLVCRCFDTHDYDNLSTKLAQNAARMVGKVDQCKLLIKCAHLFYSSDQNETRFRNPQRSLECLQRALKIADSCIALDSSNLHLLVDILSAYILFYEWRSPVISTKFITGLIALIQEYLRNSPSDHTSAFLYNYNQVIDYIERKRIDPTTAELFALIIF